MDKLFLDTTQPNILLPACRLLRVGISDPLQETCQTLCLNSRKGSSQRTTKTGGKPMTVGPRPRLKKCRILSWETYKWQACWWRSRPNNHNPFSLEEKEKRDEGGICCTGKYTSCRPTRSVQNWTLRSQGTHWSPAWEWRGKTLEVVCFDAHGSTNYHSGVANSSWHGVGMGVFIFPFDQSQKGYFVGWKTKHLSTAKLAANSNQGNCPLVPGPFSEPYSNASDFGAVESHAPEGVE